MPQVSSKNTKKYSSQVVFETIDLVIQYLQT